jgi:hypothetical protein
MYTGENRPIAEKQRQKQPITEKKSWGKNFDTAPEQCLDLLIRTVVSKEPSRSFIFVLSF